MVIAIFCDIVENGYKNSRTVTVSLLTLQLEQNTIYIVNRKNIKSAPIWLATLPLKDERYCLNKQEF